MSDYYKNKINTLKSIFKSEKIIVKDNRIIVDNREYPVVNDVIILLEYASRAENSDNEKNSDRSSNQEFSREIQYTFGKEWTEYSEILPEHEKEFQKYFDIVDISSLKDKRVCDLGCGNGRWSFFLQRHCREIILVDFSEAIFRARKNLEGYDNCLFFQSDIKKLPFRDDFADFIFCLGVLHHLPTPCLDEVVNLKKYAKEILVFLYYSLDNRPAYFKIILCVITGIRILLSKIKSPLFRKIFSVAGTYLLYVPLIITGHLLQIINLGRFVPLYDFYRDKSAKRIQQDVYDRFFTGIEQRVSKKQILDLKKYFSSIIVSENMPYWHFMCKR